MEPVPTSPQASLDITKLEQAVDRIDVALEALQGANLTEDQVKKLQDLLAAQSSNAGVTTQKTPAQEMIDSYAFDERTGVSTFTVPAGLTDVEAMKALNQYFRDNLPSFHRDAIEEAALEWYERLPEEHHTYCQRRDYSQVRHIAIVAVVKGTRGKSRVAQESVLKVNSLGFADPRDQALAAAIHACKHGGRDLFNDQYARGSLPGFALFTGGSCFGVLAFTNGGEGRSSGFAASGSPLPESK